MFPAWGSGLMKQPLSWTFLQREWGSSVGSCTDNQMLPFATHWRDLILWFYSTIRRPGNIILLDAQKAESWTYEVKSTNNSDCDLTRQGVQMRSHYKLNSTWCPSPVWDIARGLVALMLGCTLVSPGLLVKLQIAGLHLQSSGFSKCGMGPQNLHS